MEIKKSSWHYRLNKYMHEDDTLGVDPPKNLCGYLLMTLRTFLMMTIVGWAAYAFVLGIGALAYRVTSLFDFLNLAADKATVMSLKGSTGISIFIDVFTDPNSLPTLGIGIVTILVSTIIFISLFYLIRGITKMVRKVVNKFNLCPKIEFKE